MPLDAIQPGATALTRTGAHSSAAVSVKLSMPARAAPEWPMPGMPFHMSAMMLTIAPPRGAPLPSSSSIHCVTHSRAIRKPPVRLLRTTASQPLALIAASGDGNWPPALLTSASMRPCAASTAATVACTAASSRMSQTCVEQTPPAASISALHGLELVDLAADDARRAAPSAASSCAVQRPMPEPPPVTMATWPRRDRRERSIGSSASSEASAGRPDYR